MFSNEQLLSPDCDEAAYLRYALHSTPAVARGEQARLASCLEKARDSIHDILSQHTDGMIEQLRAAHQAQREVSAVRQSTDSLTKATGRLRLMIEEPYNLIQSKVQELESTNRVADVLGDVLKFLTLSARLQQQQESATDITRAARTLKEVEDLLSMTSVRGIDVVENRIRTIEKSSASIRSRAQDLLSMQTLMQQLGSAQDDAARSASLNRVVVDVGTALQCFYSLGTLQKSVLAFMTERKREVIKSIMRELDSQSITDALATSEAGGAKEVLQRTQDVLLSRVQGVLFATVQHTQAVLLLWRVLLCKQDSVTHVGFFTALDTPAQLLIDYWSTVMDKLRERLVGLRKRADFHAALSAGFPHYQLLMDSFLSSSGTLAAAASSASASASPTGSLEATLLAMNIRQWGMGDYLDLIQLVEMEGKSSGSRRSVERRSGETERLKQVWLSQVADDLEQRFAAQVMDRHREHIAPALTKLVTITPTTAALGNQPLSLSVADARRGSIPSQANPLDLGHYSRFALQDCYTHRQYPHGLPAVVMCIIKCAGQVLQKMKDSIGKYPLPPLPAVTSSVTRSQLLHICIANGCAELSADLTNIMALLPEATDIQLEQRQQLNAVVEALSTVAEGCSKPFIDSIRVVLLATISPCLAISAAPQQQGGTAGSMSAAGQQVSKRMEVFLTHYYLLLDPRTPGLAQNTRHLVDALLARVLTLSTAVDIPAAGGNRLLLHRLKEVSAIVLNFANGTQSSTGATRSTLLLKGALRQTELLYGSLPTTVEDAGFAAARAAEYVAILKPLYPLLAKLLVVQQLAMLVPAAAASPPPLRPAARMGNTTHEVFVEIVEQGLLRFCDDSLPASADERLVHAEAAAGQCFAELSQRVPGASLMKEVGVHIFNSK